MRISALPGDPGYAPLAFSRARVFLAGVERRDVLTADEEKRFALLADMDERGAVIANPGTEKARTVEFYGDVRIELAYVPWPGALTMGDCIV